MAHPTDSENHGELVKVSAGEFRAKAGSILEAANAGTQTAILTERGTVRAVVGFNGCRYLPVADPDPLDEVLFDALADAQGVKKK